MGKPTSSTILMQQQLQPFLKGLQITMTVFFSSPLPLLFCFSSFGVIVVGGMAIIHHRLGGWCPMCPEYFPLYFFLSVSWFIEWNFLEIFYSRRFECFYGILIRSKTGQLRPRRRQWSYRCGYAFGLGKPLSHNRLIWMMVAFDITSIS